MLSDETAPPGTACYGGGCPRCCHRWRGTKRSYTVSDRVFVVKRAAGNFKTQSETVLDLFMAEEDDLETD